MKKQNREFSSIAEQAIQIIEQCAANLGLTMTETADIILRIRMGASAFVAHIRNNEARCNPMRVAYLGILDWRKSEDRWYTPFRNHKRMNIQRAFANNWSRMDPRGTAARPINPVTQLANANN